MIKCKMHQDDQERISFDAEITGVAEDVLIELMKINGMLIKNFRKRGIPDELIEKQLVNCIVAGFEIDKIRIRGIDMDKCHKDEYLDSLIGRKVTITFKDGSNETGILTYPVLGIGYAVKTPSCDVAFCKSHVRCIKTLP